MRNILIVVDMQNDFIDGSLGTKEAQEIVTPVAGKIRNFEGDIYGTLDTHEEDYLSTQEGKNLPVKHCICGEDGWALNSEIMQAIAETKAEVHNFCRKGTFGSMELAQILKETYEGLKYIKNQSKIMGALVSLFVISTIAMNNEVVLPVLARETLNLGSKGFSMLYSALGFGSLIGALRNASRKNANLSLKTLFNSGINLSLFPFASYGFL